MQHGKCVKTKPGYPIVSCRGRVRLPEDTKQTVFGRANLSPTHETTALSTFCPPVCKVCSVYVRIGLHIRWHKSTRIYASGHTYIHIELHVRTHEPARIYVIVSGSVILKCRNWISLSSLLTKAFLCCIFVVRQI